MILTRTTNADNVLAQANDQLNLTGSQYIEVLAKADECAQMSHHDEIQMEDMLWALDLVLGWSANHE